MGDHAACAKCLEWLHKDRATKITASISPAIVVYYHPECYDPWSDVVGHGAAEAADPVNNPPHYRWLPNGIEVIDITETLNFCLGNAIKYILRADHKGKPEEDIRKSIWYLQRELSRRSVTMATKRERAMQ